MKRKSYSFAAISVLVIALGVGLCGCGAIFQKTTAELSIASNPAEAAATVTGGPKKEPEKVKLEVKTPDTVTVKRKYNYKVTVEKPGYESQTVDVKKEMNIGYFLLDLIWIGVVPGTFIPLPWGPVIDGVTGGWWNLKPTTVNVTLQKAETPSEEPEGEVLLESEPVNRKEPVTEPDHHPLF